MSPTGPIATQIRAKLTAALEPSRLDIVDDSQRHAGHTGARPEGETHFSVLIVSEVFAGQNRIERQRQIHRILASELAGPVHALSLKTMTAAEIASSAP